MRTTKPFSTISYNSNEHLVDKLDGLIKRNEIEFWVFVEHYAEDDETKKHKHVYIVPSRLFDTNTLIDYLMEIDKSDILAKPLTCIHCVSSKFGDWYLYSSHDMSYLLSKAQSRAYHYNISDFVTSDEDYFAELRHTIDYTRYKTNERLVEAARKGELFEDLIINGVVPVNLVSQYRIAWNFIISAVTRRNDRPGHEVDPLTGEIK